MRSGLAIILTSLVMAGATTFVGASDAQTLPPSLRQALDAAVAASPTPKSVLADQADWQTSLAEPGVDREDAIGSRLERLQAIANRDRRLAAIRDVALPGPSCVVEALKGCSAFMGGWLASRGHVLHWQLQSGFTDADGGANGVVFLTGSGARLHPVAWGFDAARFDAPVLFGDGDQTYVAVPGIHGGSGAGNADLVFRWTPGADRELVQVDTWSWMDQLQTQLPAGLSGRSVRMDYHEMFATTPLWREQDGACCATGGTALLSFEIRDDVLTLTEVRVQRPDQAAE